MVAAAAAAAVLTCRPAPGLGPLTYTRGSVRHVLDLATCRDHRLPPTRERPAPLVSPNGKWIATVRVTGGKEAIHAAGRDLLSFPRWSPTAKNGSPGPIMLIGWSGDSTWIFYAIDPMNSASIVADGVSMRAVSLTGTVRTVAPTLAYNDYRVWCGGRLVITAGGDRIAAHHKQLLVTTPPSWRATPLVHAPRRAWGSLACVSGGRSVVVQSQRDAGVDMSSVWAHWSLWRVGLDGSQQRLTSPPPSYSDDSPRFSPDGHTLFFVRSRKGVGAVYALRSGRLLGPFVSLGFNLGYYGHHDWPYAVRR